MREHCTPFDYKVVVDNYTPELAEMFLCYALVKDYTASQGQQTQYSGAPAMPAAPTNNSICAYLERGDVVADFHHNIFYYYRGTRQSNREREQQLENNTSCLYRDSPCSKGIFGWRVSEV